MSLKLEVFNTVTNKKETLDLSVISSGVTTVDHTFTTTVGAWTAGQTLAAGANIDAVLAKLGEPYVSSAFASFTLGLTGGAPSWEIGQAVTVNNGSWTVTNDSEGLGISNITIAGTGFTNAIRPSSPATADAANKTVDTSTYGAKTWTISGLNSIGGAVTRAYTGNAYYTVTFGASQTVVTDNVSAKAVYDSMATRSLQADNNALTTAGTALTATNGYFTYIFIPVSYGTLSNVIQGGALPVRGSFDAGTVYTFLNAQGASCQYNVYKSNASGAFGNGVSLAISWT